MVFPLQEVVSIVKFKQSRFLNFFIIVPSFLEVLLTSSSFSSTILWWLPSLSFLVQKFLTSKNFTTLKKMICWDVDPQSRLNCVFWTLISPKKVKNVFWINRCHNRMLSHPVVKKKVTTGCEQPGSENNWCDIGWLDNIFWKEIFANQTSDVRWFCRLSFSWLLFFENKWKICSAPRSMVNSQCSSLCFLTSWVKMNWREEKRERMKKEEGEEGEWRSWRKKNWKNGVKKRGEV